MRASKGCQACRTRHTKCTKKKDQSVCTRCQENNQECIFDSKWRFKHVAHVDTASQGIRSRTRLAYDADQPWVSSRKIAKFVLENGDAMDIDVLEAFDCQDNDENADERALIEPDMDVYETQIDNFTTSAAQDPSMNGLVNPPTNLQRTEDSFANQASTVLKPDSGDRPSTDLQDSDCPPPLLFEYGDPDTDPVNDSLENLELGPERCSFEDLNSGISPTRALENPVCFTACLSHREVLLMQHFIHKLSPWLDVCDITARFANEVPVRAMNSPMLLYAVLAISAGHQAGSDEDRHEASEYHGKCLELVIPALSQPERCFDDILLATIVCLRCYEEFNTQADDYLHLNGTARLLSAIPHFSHSGGLAESASWQALRQDIYVSLIQKQPPTFELDNYDKSSVFNSLDFGAAANVIILLFAKILRCLYSSECNNNYTVWQGLEVAVDQWNVQRVFQPSYYQDAQAESGKPFPTICMISAPQGMKFIRFQVELLIKIKSLHCSTIMLVKCTSGCTVLSITTVQDLKPQENNDVLRYQYFSVFHHWLGTVKRLGRKRKLHRLSYFNNM
ncbi:hypothetical protein KCU83_g8695, partial [Aureobasidium melanogenum]